LFLSCSLSCF